MEPKSIILRPVKPIDLEQILDILTSEKVNQTYMLPDYETRSDAVPLFRRLTELSEDGSRFVRCITLDGVAIGFVNDVEIKDGTIELGYAIHPDYHNQGYMTRALTAAIEELFKIGYSCIICAAFSENSASIRVMEKTGMVLLDKTNEIEYRNKLHHCIYYGIRNEESPC